MCPDTSGHLLHEYTLPDNPSPYGGPSLAYDPDRNGLWVTPGWGAMPNSSNPGYQDICFLHANGTIDVRDDHVILEVTLPWLLAQFVEKIAPAIRKQGTLMLEKK